MIIPDRRLVKAVPLRAGRMTVGWVLDDADANKRIQISREARKELPGKKKSPENHKKHIRQNRDSILQVYMFQTIVYKTL